MVSPVEFLAHALAFVAAGAAVAWAGSVLAHSADAIAELTGIGRMWVGSMLLAAATSLPELTIDVFAVRFGATDLAAGDLFGSNMANMLILASLDLAFPRKRLLRQAAFDHALSASLAISLNAGAALFVLMRLEGSVMGVSPGSLALALAYLLGSRAVFRQARPGEAGATAATTGVPSTGLRAATLRFAAATAVVLAAAPVLAWAARGIAELSGLGETFVGTWLVGLTTSLPELVASVAAIRLGSFDLAVGNLFGSNAFNMMIFLALDLAEPRGAIFALIEPEHVVSALFAVILTSLGAAAIVYRAERRLPLIDLDSWLMVVLYLLAISVLYGRATGG
jgi:cation:H+ antiporter